jgi:hypothetical protein
MSNIQPIVQMDLMKISWNVVNMKEMIQDGIHMMKNSVLIQLLKLVTITNGNVGMVLVFLPITTVMVPLNTVMMLVGMLIVQMDQMKSLKNVVV